MIDVFGGSGFVANATNHLGLRGYALHTNFGPRHDMTNLFVFTRIRQDVSTGQQSFPPPRLHTSCSSLVISASASIAKLLHRARIPWILEHLCDSRSWDVPKLQTCAAQIRTAWALADFTWTAEICTELLAHVLEREVVVVFQDKNMSILKTLHHARVTTPALTV